MIISHPAFIVRVVAMTTLMAVIPYSALQADDCTGTLPGVNCTLDEDTTAPLTVDTGVTLFIGDSVVIGHTVDGDDVSGDGDIQTFGGPNNITQNADIGSITPIESLTILDDNVWTTSAAINTDNDGSDIDLDGADGGEILNFLSGASYGGEIVGHAADIVNFGSDAGGGTFLTGGQIEGVSVIITSGSLTVNNTVGGGTGLGALDVDDGASLIMNANVSTDGVLDLDGSVRIRAGSTLAADTYNADLDAAEVTMEVRRNTGVTDIGSLSVANGGPVDLSNDIFRAVVASDSAVLTNETIAGFVVGNGGATIQPGTFIDSSYLYNFSLQSDGADNLDLVVAVNPLESVASSANNLEAAELILGQAADTTIPALNQIQSLLGNDSNSAAFNERLESLQPTVDGGYIASSLSMVNHVQDYAHDRVVDSHSRKSLGETKTGKAILVSGRKNLLTGRSEKNEEIKRQGEGQVQIWMNAFAQSAEQKNKDSIDGYDMSIGGVAMGADTGDMHEDLVVGVAIYAGQSEVDSQNANQTKTDIDSYGLSFYGGRNLTKKTILSGSATYLHANNSTLRKDLGGVGGNNAIADFASEHIALKSEVSHRFDTTHNVSLRPSFSIDYDFISADEYAESGVDYIALEVDYDSWHTLAAEFGLDMQWLYKTAGGTSIIPSTFAKYKYNVLNDKVGSVSTVRDLGSFSTEGFENPRSMLNMGLNLAIDTGEHLSFGAGYNFEVKDSYYAHMGAVNLAYNF